MRPLVHRGGAQFGRIKDLDTSDFFHKLPGYDTLRFVLSQKSILVEGDADELVVQRAYMDANEGKLPIDDEIDVISVGLSFLRFLELATALKIPVVVATDNDGDTAAVERKYAKYKDVDHIRICYDPVVDTGDLVLSAANPSITIPLSRNWSNRIASRPSTSCSVPSMIAMTFIVI